MDLNNLENKFFHYLDKFSRLCDEEAPDEEIRAAFQKASEVWQELKDNGLDKKMYKDYKTADFLFKKLDGYLIEKKDVKEDNRMG